MLAADAYHCTMQYVRQRTVLDHAEAYIWNNVHLQGSGTLPKRPDTGEHPGLRQ
jgi:hypothetical protein